MMSPATIHKFIKQYQETQDLTAQKPGTKKSSKLEEHRELIMKMVESHADWTLQQYSDYLAEHCHVDASLSILCRFLQKEKLTLKKRVIAAKRLRLKQGKNSELSTRLYL
jgi:transposase